MDNDSVFNMIMNDAALYDDFRQAAMAEYEEGSTDCTATMTDMVKLQMEYLTTQLEALNSVWKHEVMLKALPSELEMAVAGRDLNNAFREEWKFEQDAEPEYA